MDFTIVKKAGLSQREFAALCGVSRETANMWCRGKWKPHKLHGSAIEGWLIILRAAVAAGRLPIPSHIRGVEARMERIRSAISFADLGT